MGAQLVRVVGETVVGDAIQYEVLAGCPLVIDSSSNTIRPMDQAAGGGPNSALTARRTVARSLDATIDVLVSPRAGFEAIARGRISGCRCLARHCVGPVGSLRSIQRRAVLTGSS